jgi:cystathionine beta-synthase
VGDRLRNYIGKDWFLEIAFRQEPSALGKRIAEVLGRPAGEGKGKETAKNC